MEPRPAAWDPSPRGTRRASRVGRLHGSLRGLGIQCWAKTLRQGVADHVELCAEEDGLLRSLTRESPLKKLDDPPFQRQVFNIPGQTIQQSYNCTELHVPKHYYILGTFSEPKEGCRYAPRTLNDVNYVMYSETDLPKKYVALLLGSESD